MSKEIVFNQEAREKIKSGIDKVANIVGVTLDPRGRNVLIRKSWGTAEPTKDGVTVARELSFKDHFEDVGARLCTQAASKTNDSVGDATTTSTILTQSIIAEGFKYVNSGVNPVSLKNGIDFAVSHVVDYINSQHKKINHENLWAIQQVATISANNSEIGKIVADAFHSAGADGVVTFEESKGRDTVIETTEGFQVDRGYISPYFITNGEKMTCEYEDCLILFWDKRITTMQELIPVLKSVAVAKKPLLIVADDVELDPLSLLVENKLKGNVQVVAIKCPGFGERKRNLMEDMALLTGGTYYTEEMGKKLDNISVADLGTAKKITVSKDSTTIIGGGGDKEKISEHVKNLKKMALESDSKTDLEKYAERVAKLSGSVAIIKIGASIDSEMRDKKYRYEDAISATKAALGEQGVIAGGGTVLFGARKHLTKLMKKTMDPDLRLGISIVEKSLSAPLMKILENAGFDVELVNKIVGAVSNGKGYDGRTGKVIPDMYEAGIIDPTKAVVEAVYNASAVASIFLSTEAIIVDEPSEEKNSNPYMQGY